MKKKAPDAPAPFAHQREEKDDSVGNVMVTITRRNGKTYVKGSLTRAFTVKNAKVSTVAEILEVALFGSIKPARSSRGSR